METLGDRIKYIRGATSQARFSTSLGITQTKLSRYERNTTPPEVDFLVRLARQYSVSLEWLIIGAGNMRSARTCDSNASPTSTNEIEDISPTDIQQVMPSGSMQKELADERMERRELAAENRQLHKENAALLRENGELREKLARLEERKNRLAVATDQSEEDSGAA